MTYLSSTARIVKEAVLATYSPDLPPKSIWALEQAGVAAALRTAAEELQYRLFLPGSDPMIIDAKALFDLANELEGQ